MRLNIRSLGNEVSYQGKTVNVGIDVHNKSYVLSAYCDGVVIKKSCRMIADPQACAQFISETFNGAEIPTAYESVLMIPDYKKIYQILSSQISVKNLPKIFR